MALPFFTIGKWGACLASSHSIHPPKVKGTEEKKKVNAIKIELVLVGLKKKEGGFKKPSSLWTCLIIT